MDVLWHYLSYLGAANNSSRFPRLTSVGKLVLTIPHSNAQEERLFSMVRMNKTAFRPSLDPKGTLSSILAIKFAAKEPAHCYEPTKAVLSGAKAATWEYSLKKIESSVMFMINFCIMIIRVIGLVCIMISQLLILN